MLLPGVAASHLMPLHFLPFSHTCKTDEPSKTCANLVIQGGVRVRSSLFVGRFHDTLFDIQRLGVFFLPHEHLRLWTESISYAILVGADRRSYAGTADHPVVFVCIISCIKHHAPSGTLLIISRNTGESCASPRVTAQDTIFLPLTSVTMCSLTNSRLKMWAFLGIPTPCIPGYGNHCGVANSYPRA